MLIQELLGQTPRFGSRETATIRTKCSQFLKESAGLPLYKNLPKTYTDFQRVKVRQQKRFDKVSEAFNKAFGTQFHNLRQRAIFAHSTPLEVTEEHEPFYIFPVDGYKFLFSKEIKNSNNDYKHVLDVMFEQFEDNDKAIEIVTDLLKYTYHRTSLIEGIMSESEIIIYGVPSYYVLRVSVVPHYGKLFVR